MAAGIVVSADAEKAGKMGDAIYDVIDPGRRLGKEEFWVKWSNEDKAVMITLARGLSPEREREIERAVAECSSALGIPAKVDR